MYQKNSSEIEKAGKPCDCGECEVCKVFGTGDANTLKSLPPEKQPGPARAKFFDAYPTEDTLNRLQNALGQGIFTEIKTENQINRITSRANPRKVERVPAGSEFEGNVIFDCYKESDNDLIGVIFNGMKKLEDSFLGGYGSRGSGRVQFKDIEVIWRPADYYKGNGNEEKVVDKAKSVDEILSRLEEIKQKCS